MFYVAVTTLMLVTLTIMVAMDLPFNSVFYLTCIGQIMAMTMVYKVLRDNYSTNKTFEDFYEDHPVGNRKDAFR